MEGYSTSTDIFEKSASGGLLTTILLAAKDFLGLDAILAVGRDPNRPGYAKGRLCRSYEELLETCQSTYQLFPYLEVIRDVLIDEAETRIAVVGLACHIQSIRKLQQLPSRSVSEHDGVLPSWPSRRAPPTPSLKAATLSFK